MKFLYSILIFVLVMNLVAQDDVKKDDSKIVEEANKILEKTAPLFTKENPENSVCLIKTSFGDIYVELFDKDAPKTVKNFIDLAEGKKEGKFFYDNLIFHRVIKNFMIQGGCPLGNGTGDPGYKFEDEINADSLELDKPSVFDKEKGFHSFVDPRVFHIKVLGPLYRKMGIKSQEDLEKRMQEILTELTKISLKNYYESLGYKYNPNLKSHHPERGVLAMANSGPDTNGSQFFINVIETPWLAGKHTVFGKVIRGMEVVDKITEQEVDERARPKKEIKILSIRLYKEK